MVVSDKLSAFFDGWKTSRDRQRNRVRLADVGDEQDGGDSSGGRGRSDEFEEVGDDVERNGGSQNDTRTGGSSSRYRSGQHGRYSNYYGDDDADERTSLLSDRRGEGLDPDDPSVSPYNLQSVRALRSLSGFFLCVTLAWWLLLILTTFVTFPGFGQRGSGFFAFAYTTLTAENILLGLAFFTIPSAPMFLWTSAMTLFLFVNLMIIVCVPQLRQEEGWIGIVSVVWALIVSTYILFQTRLVNWGKHEEEERLTGRGEHRRPLREWLAILAQLVLLPAMVIMAILLMSTVSLRAKDATLKPPGQKYWVENHRYQVHLHCVGNPKGQALPAARRGYGDDDDDDDDGATIAPTILVEAGEYPAEHTLEGFIDEAYLNDTIARYCIWDRPGVGWSDNAASPHSASMSMDALSEALNSAGEEGPYVLVASGEGGIYSRIFASRHASQTKGLLLIDALHEDLLDEYIGGVRHGLALWLRGVIIAPLGLDRLSGAIFQRRTSRDRVCGAKAYQSDKFVKAALQENLAVVGGLTVNDIERAKEAQDPKLPLAVVASGTQANRDSKWATKQRELGKITDNLKMWSVVDGAPHEVWTVEEGKKVLTNALRKLVGDE